jgi:DNA topoisomerase-1
MLAQRLYEGGFITYMRTDSTFLSDDAVNMVRNHIQQNFGEKYFPANQIVMAIKRGTRSA